jgi:two-component system cell cycle sensor histidine kinase/response regulator CckA
MTPDLISVLLIEDNPADVRLIEEMLKDAQAQVSLTVADSLTAGAGQLERNHYDVVLLDLGLPESSGLDTYRKLRDKFRDIAVIVLTGLDDYEVATTAVREGAQDYIVKGQVDPNPLARSIRYAYDRKQTESALRMSEEKYRILFAANLAGVYRSTPDGKILECNEAMAKMLGYRSPEELLGVKTPATYANPTERQIMLTQLEKRKSLQNYEIKLRAKDGDEVWCLMNVVLLESGEKILQGNLVDITERKRAEEKLRMLARVVEQVGEGVAVATLDGELTFANAAWAKMHGLEVEEITGKHLSIFHNKEHLP